MGKKKRTEWKEFDAPEVREPHALIAAYGFILIYVVVWVPALYLNCYFDVLTLH